MRRAVAMNCEVISRYWDEPVAHSIRDLSPYGAWVDTPWPLACGQQVLVSFSVADRHAPTPFLFLARVSRVWMQRRKNESFRSGMAFEFVNIPKEEAFELEKSLLGLPPPLPTHLASKGTTRAVGDEWTLLSSSEESVDLSEFLPDAETELEFTALAAPLLNAIPSR